MSFLSFSMIKLGGKMSKLDIESSLKVKYNLLIEQASTHFACFLLYNQICTIYVINKESHIMTENETFLINLIREHKRPDVALVTAIEVILDFLNHPESSASKSPVVSPESIEIIQASLSHSR